MLDNNEINEQFATESWEKMRLLLDAEMPVTEDRRRRPLIWIWSRTMGIAASMLLVGIGTWWIAQGNFSSNPDPALASAPAVILPESAGQTGLHQVSGLEQVPPQVSLQDQHAVSNAIPSQKSFKRASGSMTSSSSHNRAMGVPGSGLFSKAEAAQMAVTTPASSAVNPIGAVSEDLALVESVPSRLPEASLVQLPGLNLAGVLTGKEADLAAAAIPVAKVHGGWRQGPELGGIASFPTSLAGFHAGWAAEMPIADGLALRGALRYDFQRQTVSNSDRQQYSYENAMIDFAEDPFNPIESAVGAPAVDVDSVVSSSTLKMHYAALPLSLSVKLNDRWRAEGGVQVAYLFRAFREGRDEPSSLVTNGTADLDNYTRSSWYFSNKIQQVAQESFQPWDFALSAGLRYQVARHWNVGISGNYGLLNQANKANGYRIFNRNAVLSVGYYF